MDSVYFWYTDVKCGSELEAGAVQALGVAAQLLGRYTQSVVTLTSKAQLTDTTAWLRQLSGLSCAGLRLARMALTQDQLRLLAETLPRLPGKQCVPFARVAASSKACVRNNSEYMQWYYHEESLKSCYGSISHLNSNVATLIHAGCGWVPRNVAGGDM